MKKDTIFVGLDVHKSSISVAVAGRDDEVRSLGAVANSPEAVAELESTTPSYFRGCEERPAPPLTPGLRVEKRPPWGL